MHRDSWFAQVESLVDLEDVRWIFVSHDDSDHVGNLHELLDRCPNATLVANFFMHERMAVEPQPLGGRVSGRGHQPVSRPRAGAGTSSGVALVDG
jgi:glyoxylase-like metal-dependent hydrolase (beta-lactamase superfamily II)